MAPYSLDEVKSLVQMAQTGDISKVWFSGRSRSLDYIIHVFGHTESEAQNLVLNGLLRLQNRDFSRSIVLQTTPESIVADEYGLKQYKNHNWYIKFLIETDESGRSLTSISFHPVERTLRVTDGRNLEVTLEPGRWFKTKKRGL